MYKGMYKNYYGKIFKHKKILIDLFFAINEIIHRYRQPGWRSSVKDKKVWKYQYFSSLSIVQSFFTLCRISLSPYAEAALSMIGISSS